MRSGRDFCVAKNPLLARSFLSGRSRFLPDGGGSSLRSDETIDYITGMKIGIARRLSIDDQTDFLAVRLANHMPIGLPFNNTSLYCCHPGCLAGVDGRIREAGILMSRTAGIARSRACCAGRRLRVSLHAVV